MGWLAGWPQQPEKLNLRHGKLRPRKKYKKTTAAAAAAAAAGIYVGNEGNAL